MGTLLVLKYCLISEPRAFEIRYKDLPDNLTKSALLVLTLAILALPAFSSSATGALAQSSTQSHQSALSSGVDNSASIQIVKSVMATGVNNKGKPTGVTKVFNASDADAFSWIKFTGQTAGNHVLTWLWITPWKQIFSNFTTTQALTTGCCYTFYVDIATPEALPFPGAWQVKFYFDGALALSQKFTLESPYLTPEGVRDAYGVAPLIQEGYTGKGVTIAIINTGVGSTFNSDVKDFSKQYGLPAANVTVIKPFGTSGTDLETPPGETTGDVEFAHAMAPSANIIVVATGSISNFYNGFAYVINNKIANIASVSPSWALAGASEKNTVKAENDEFAKSVAENITLIAASNDWGSNNTVEWGSNSGTFWTNYLPNAWLMPQYSPYFTAVGGTALTLNSTGGYGSEIGWNQSGGGPSNLFAEPSWQKNGAAKADGVPQNKFRDMPDVALDASCSTPYSFIRQGEAGGFCGTSGAAPTFAGIVADIDQGLGHSVGFLNPLLYSIASTTPGAFNDVTSGCSLVNNTGSVVQGYCAKPGWDYVTGLGSPDSSNLFNALMTLLEPAKAISSGAASPNSFGSYMVAPARTLLTFSCGSATTSSH